MPVRKTLELPNLTLKQILSAVDDVSSTTDYWFVRTESGSLFDKFWTDGYIGIGWDEITLSDIRNKTDIENKTKIASVYDYNLKTVRGKMRATFALNKLKIFVGLKRNDVVIMPSTNSDVLAFGIVQDEQAYEAEGEEEFIKRRKVKWLESKSIAELSPVFYQVKTNQHTISNVNRFAPDIDRVVGSLYKKGDRLHFVMKINQEGDIDFDDLNTLMDNIKSLEDDIRRKIFSGGEDDKLFVKVNLQSKGLLELLKKGASLSVLAYILALAGCNETDVPQDPAVQQIIDDNKTTIENSSLIIDKLKMDTSALKKPFVNGN